MARLFDDASNEYLEIGSAVLVATPLTMACWFYTDMHAGANQELMWLGDKDFGDEYWALGAYGDVGASHPVRATARSTTANYAETTAAYSLNTWQHAAAVFTSSAARAAFLNGGNKGTESTSRTPANADRTSIGRSGDSSPGKYVSGRIAEAAIWNVALTDAEVAIFAKGYSPLFVRPQSLVAYWPLIRDEDQDRVGGYDLTAFNTPSVAAHAPVLYPAARQPSLGTAAAPGLSMPVAMHHYRQMRTPGATGG